MSPWKSPSNALLFVNGNNAVAATSQQHLPHVVFVLLSFPGEVGTAARCIFHITLRELHPFVLTRLFYVVGAKACMWR